MSQVVCNSMSVTSSAMDENLFLVVALSFRSCYAIFRLRAGRHVTAVARRSKLSRFSGTPKTLCFQLLLVEPHLSLDHRAVDSSNRPIRVFVSTFSVCACVHAMPKLLSPNVYFSRALPASFYMLCVSTLVIQVPVLSFRFMDIQCPTASLFTTKPNPNFVSFDVPTTYDLSKRNTLPKYGSRGSLTAGKNNRATLAACHLLSTSSCPRSCCIGICCVYRDLVCIGIV